MEITLKSVKHFPSLSEETEAYSASVYVDGKKIGTIENTGKGEEDRFQGDRQAYANATAWLAENRPTQTFGDRTYKHTLEDECGDLLGRWILESALKKSLKTHILAVEDGELRQWKYKGVKTITDVQTDAFKRQHPTLESLNDMSFDKALEVFKKYT